MDNYAREKTSAIRRQEKKKKKEEDENDTCATLFGNVRLYSESCETFLGVVEVNNMF